MLPDLENLSQILEHDALILQIREQPGPDFSFSGQLTDSEINNLRSYISTGRRVILTGEWGSCHTVQHKDGLIGIVKF